MNATATPTREQVGRVRRAPTITGKLWMVLLQAQRPMRRRELRQTLDAMATQPVCRRSFESALGECKLRGYLTVEGRTRELQFAVTPACNVPPSIRLADVLEAVQA